MSALLSPNNLARHGRIATYWAVELRKYPAALAVAVILSAYARTEKGTRVCWPSEKQIADELGISPRAVRGAIQRLFAVGFIRERQRRFSKSTHTSIWDYQPARFHSPENDEDAF